MIEVKHLTKVYGTNVAVNDISFNIEKGKIYGFLGPNGAGKSTTMNIITGCLAATSGTVVIDGHDIFDEPIEAKKLIGYLPEIPPLYVEMTVLEYLAFVSDAKGVAYDKKYREIKNVLKLTGLEDKADKLIRNLSKGYKQRVGIAQAMIGNPDVIILDEPTVGLDPKQIIEIRELIANLGKVKTVIISSHILSEISEICDHIIIISRGKVVADDSLENLEYRASRQNGLRVVAKCPKAEFEQILSKIENITYTDVAEKEGKTEAVLNSSDSGDAMTERVFNAFSAARTPISEMFFRESSLENIFLSLTSEYAPATPFASEEKQDEQPAPDAPAGDDYKPLFSENEEEDDK